MYNVKIEATRELRSIHQETLAGLTRAIVEADMRTHATGQPHIVVDDNGYKMHTALPHEVAAKPIVKKQERDVRWVLLFVAVIFIYVTVMMR